MKRSEFIINSGLGLGALAALPILSLAAPIPSRTVIAEFSLLPRTTLLWNTPLGPKRLSTIKNFGQSNVKVTLFDNGDILSKSLGDGPVTIEYNALGSLSNA